MRAVSRGNQPAPACLDAADKKGLTELQRARAHELNANPKKGSFEFAIYKHDEVKLRLNALFHGKCAYCETFYSASAPVDVEHYRPKGAVSEDETHPGYWWLAMRWDNVLPSCIDCNRKRKQRVPLISTSLADLYRSSPPASFASGQSGKKDSFPIAATGQRLQPEGEGYGTELPLLLDPTRDDPQRHLRFHIDHKVPLGMVLPVDKKGVASERGAMSISVYGLNRLGLVQERTRLLRQLAFLGDLAIELGAIVEELEQPPVAAALAGAGVPEVASRLRLLQDRTLAEMKAMAQPQAPYSAMARAWAGGLQAAAGLNARPAPGPPQMRGDIRTTASGRAAALANDTGGFDVEAAAPSVPRPVRNWAANAPSAAV